MSAVCEHDYWHLGSIRAKTLFTKWISISFWKKIFAKRNSVSVWVEWAHKATHAPRPFYDILCVSIWFIPPVVPYLRQSTVSYITDSHHSRLVPQERFLRRPRTLLPFATRTPRMEFSREQMSWIRLLNTKHKQYFCTMSATLKRQSISTRLHGAASQKTATFTLIAVRTWDRNGLSTYVSMHPSLPFFLSFLLSFVCLSVCMYVCVYVCMIPCGGRD
jgi:hypothetical protein